MRVGRLRDQPPRAGDAVVTVGAHSRLRQRHPVLSFGAPGLEDILRSSDATAPAHGLPCAAAIVLVDRQEAWLHRSAEGGSMIKSPSWGGASKAVAVVALLVALVATLSGAGCFALPSCDIPCAAGEVVICSGVCARPVPIGDACDPNPCSPEGACAGGSACVTIAGSSVCAPAIPNDYFRGAACCQRPRPSVHRHAES